MKIKKIFFPFLLLILYSCSDNTTEPQNNLNQSTKTIYKVRGDNFYDVLGFGFDATKEYLDLKSALEPVIDVSELHRNTGLITSDNPTNTVLDIKSGSNETELLNKFANKFSLTTPLPIDGIPFTGTFSLDVNTSNHTVSKKSHAMATVMSYIWHHSFKKETDITVLQKHLTQSFRDDIQTRSPEQIISIYGTHVYTDIYTGGSLRFNYQSVVTSTTKELSVSFGAKIALEKVLNSTFSVSNDTHYESTSKDKFHEESASYESRGGAGGTSIFGSWIPGAAMPPINFNQWSSTIDISEPRSLQLIDIGEKSLIAIYEFVADPVKKAALKAAIDNYIIGKSFKVLPVVPLFKYKHYGRKNTLYTTNWSELGTGTTDWQYIGIAAYVCSTQEEGTVPFFRFYRTYKKFMGKTFFDHYYTRIKESGTKNYNFEGIQCYVYPDDKTEGTTALYQLWNSDIHDHYYTTDDKDIPSGYGSQSVCGYVYK